jgi:hypothetical protein
MDEYEKKAREVIEQIQHMPMDGENIRAKLEQLQHMSMEEQNTPVVQQMIVRFFNEKKNKHLIEFYLSILKSDLVSFDFFNEIYQQMVTIANDRNTNLTCIKTTYIYSGISSINEFIDLFWENAFTQHNNLPVSQINYLKYLIHNIEFLEKYYPEIEHSNQSNNNLIDCILQHSEVAFEFFTRHNRFTPGYPYLEYYQLNPKITPEKILFLMVNNNFQLRWLGGFKSFQNLNLEIITHPLFDARFRKDFPSIAIHPYITQGFILEHLEDWDFNITGLLCNPGIPWDFLKNHFPEKIKNNTKWFYDVKDIFSTHSVYYSMDETTVKKIKYQLKSKFKDISESDIEEFKLKGFLTEVCNYTPPPKNEKTQIFGRGRPIEKILGTEKFTSEQFIQLIDESKLIDYSDSNLIDDDDDFADYISSCHNNYEWLFGSLLMNENITLLTIADVISHYHNYNISAIDFNISTLTAISQRPDMTFQNIETVLKHIMICPSALTINIGLVNFIFKNLLNEEIYITHFARLHNAAFRIQYRFKNILENPYTKLGQRKIDRDYDFFAKRESKSY